MIDSCMEHVAADRMETFQSSPDESSSALMSNWDDVLANVQRAELCLWLYHSVITMGMVNGGLIFSLERDTWVWRFCKTNRIIFRDPSS